MKKNQIKFVGVCAAALLTVGALTPTASTIAHAEGGISTLALTNTQNNLKPSVNMSVKDYYNGFEEMLQNLTPLETNVAQEKISDDKWSDLWNQDQSAGKNRDTVSFNVGLQNVDLNNDGSFVPTGDRKSISQIFIKTNWLNTKEYVAGDKITLEFWGADENGDLVGTAPLASTTVTLVGAVQDYEATGQNVTAAIGDTFNLNQGVVVTNKETGKPLTYIDFSLVSGKVESNGDIIIDGTTYDQGTWYTLVDVTTKDGKENPFDNSATEPNDDDKRVKTDLDVNNNTTISKYNKAVTFDQSLKVNVYGTDGKLASGNVYYIKRTIKVVDDKAVSPVPVYRAYNSNDGDHLFTTSQSEYNNVISAGWAAENIAWNAASSNADGGKVVYRVYNANSGEHFYTASREEYMNLGKAGWTQEGEAFYSPKAEGNVAVYRAFNPNATGPGSHMFTTSKSEYDNIVKAGWTGEGVAFYGLYED